MSEHKEDCLKRAFRPLELLVTAAVAVTFVVVMVEVISRYVFHESIAWGAEVCQTLLVWITFVGGAVALVGGEHMQIDAVLANVRSELVKRILLFAGYVSVLIFLGCGVYGGIRLVEKTWNMTTTTLQIPAGILYMAFPIGCSLMFIVTVRNILSLFLNKRGDR